MRPFELPDKKIEQCSFWGLKSNGKLVEEPVTQTPPHLEPIVPYLGNRLRTKSLT